MIVNRLEVTEVAKEVDIKVDTKDKVATKVNFLGFLRLGSGLEPGEYLLIPNMTLNPPPKNIESNEVSPPGGRGGQGGGYRQQYQQDGGQGQGGW